MFWVSDLAENSSLQNLLAKENVKLEEVLDDAFLLQELRAGTSGVIEFFYKDDNIQKLCKFAVTEPPPCPDGEKKRYRHAYKATEALVCDPKILEKAMETDEECFKIINQFLDSPPPLNPLLASFFSKIFLFLIKSFTDATVTYMQNNPDFLDKLLKHFYCSSVAYLLSQSITNVEYEYIANKIAAVLNQQNVLWKLLDNFDESQMNSVHSFTAQVICSWAEALAAPLEGSDSNRLLGDILSKRYAEELLDRMFKETRKDTAASFHYSCDSVFASGCAVFVTLLRIIHALDKSSVALPPNDSSSTSGETFAVCSDWTIDKCLLKYLKNFVNVILPGVPRPALALPMSVVNSPLGNARFACMKLIEQLLIGGLADVHVELSRVDIVSKLFDIFTAHPFNNFAHTIVYQVVVAIMNNSIRFDRNSSNAQAKTDSGQSVPSPLLQQMFLNGKIIRFLLEKHEENALLEKSGRPVLANYGHILRMSHAVYAALSGNSVHTNLIRDLMTSIPEALYQRWHSFISDVLLPYKFDECDDVSQLVSSDTIVGDSEINDIGLPSGSTCSPVAQALFAEYHSQQMTTSVPDCFGYPQEAFIMQHEEDIDSAMLEATNFMVELDEIKESAGEEAFAAFCAQRVSEETDFSNEETEEISRATSTVTEPLKQFEAWSAAPDELPPAHEITENNETAGEEDEERAESGRGSSTNVEEDKDKTDVDSE